jgi:hypothetical protein
MYIAQRLNVPFVSKANSSLTQSMALVDAVKSAPDIVPDITEVAQI